MEKVLDQNIAERKSTVCKGCGKEKQLGLVVCWTCFKYRTDIIPLKSFEGSFSEWLLQVK